MKRIVSFLTLFFVLLNLSGQGVFTDPRDGNIYRTITIGNSTWMVENLRFKADSGTNYFDNDPNNKPGYGALYDWKTALRVCPDKWHLPAGKEFQSLAEHFDQKGFGKSAPSDTSSFGIQLGGMQNYEGTFTEMDESAYFWTSTEYDKENAEYFSYILVVKTPVADISRKDDIQDIHGAEKINKYSVRCVKD
jgi:uncharacterized protein (TIGR02145 family)